MLRRSGDFDRAVSVRRAAALDELNDFSAWRWVRAALSLTFQLSGGTESRQLLAFSIASAIIRTRPRVMALRPAE